MYDVLVIGGVGIDTIVKVPVLPLPLADSIHVGPVKDYVAHTGNGVSLGCLALGLRAFFIDVIGDDAQGATIRAHYAAKGLENAFCVHPSGTRRSVNLVDPQGRRESLYDGRHPDDYRMTAEFYRPHLDRARHVHLSIMGWCRFLFDDIAERKIPVSTDLHDWDGENPFHEEFALRSDLVFVSTASIPDRFEAVMRRILEKGRAETVVAMAGGDGAYVMNRGETTCRHFPAAVPTAPVVDSNGAGDSFVSAYLYGRIKTYPQDVCMRMGNIGGAFACTSEGTHTAFIDAEALLEACARM